MSNYILAIDQGTSSSRTFIFDSNGQIISHANEPIEMIYPHAGWIEQDPKQLWQSVVRTVEQSLQKAKLNAEDIMGIGITNQRETTVVWNKYTGEPIYNAINWQDRRTNDICLSLKEHFGTYLFQNTGLIIDPYFSATKVKWILDNVAGARSQASKGELLFGTIDTFIIWKLTNGQSHVTDITNASRTMLYNLHTGEWDGKILKELDIPESMLPSVKDSVAEFGKAQLPHTKTSIPIMGVAGDQQAALVGQNCFQSQMAKFTFGTGCFALVNTGSQPIFSTHQLLSTVGYKKGNTQAYALEGSVFIAGALVQWLRDNMGLLQSSSECESLAQQSTDESLVFVPALTGMGAPHWQPEAKGAIFGLMRETQQHDIVKAALQGVLFQTIDLIHAINADLEHALTEIRIDGGMAQNNWFLQKLSDYSRCKVTRASSTESSVMGAAWLACVGCDAARDFEKNSFWKQADEFIPHDDHGFEQQYARWKKAVACVKTFSEV